MARIRAPENHNDKDNTKLTLEHGAKQLQSSATHEDKQQQQRREVHEAGESDDDDDSESLDDDAEPIGGVIRVSGEAGEKINYFQSFQYDDRIFHLGNTVLVAPEEGQFKPYVAIIKDIFQTEHGKLMVRGQKFYRPEDAEKSEGGTWESHDDRELFCTTQVDEFGAVNVMHNCKIHMVPYGKIAPDRKQHPGFIVQKVYDLELQIPRHLTSEDYEGVFPPTTAA